MGRGSLPVDQRQLRQNPWAPCAVIYDFVPARRENFGSTFPGYGEGAGSERLLGIEGGLQDDREVPGSNRGGYQCERQVRWPSERVEAIISSLLGYVSPEILKARACRRRYAERLRQDRVNFMATMMSKSNFGKEGSNAAATVSHCQ